MRHSITPIIATTAIALTSCGQREASSTANDNTTNAESSSISSPIEPFLDARVSIAPSILRLGESFELSLNFELEPGAQPEPFEIDTLLPNDWSITSQAENTWTIEPFLPGSYVLEPLTFRATIQGEDDPRTVTVPPITIEIVSAFAQDESRELSGIRDILSPPERTNWWLVAGAAAGLIVLAAGTLAGTLFYVQQRRRPVSRPAHEFALEQLDLLDERRYLDLGSYELFLERTTSIVRQYIDHRFGIAAPERTTSELLGELRSAKKLDESGTKALSAMLSAADFVKFAAEDVDRDACEDLESKARTFINQTKSMAATILIARSGKVLRAEHQEARS
ncbi:MAG: hypothetical protein AAGB34_00530 [Planctomycetota bacterium]